MSNNIIKYICLALLLAACQEDEALLPDLSESTDRFEVTIPLGIAPETGWSYETDYVPMQTRSEEFQPALVDKQFAGLVMKEIDGAWYVDTLQFWNLDGIIKVPKTSVYLLSKENNIGKIDLILSPGHYKILVITAGKYSPVRWNKALKRGYLVKGTPMNEKNIPYACTYVQEQIGEHNYSILSREIFAGVTDFTVSKAGDLHSSPGNQNDKLMLTRRVSKYRFALEGPRADGTAFPDTQHYFYLHLSTTSPYGFCEGIDCFGKSYYPEETNQEIKMHMSTTIYRTSPNFSNEKYQLLTPYNSTYSSQYLFIDPDKKEGVPLQISFFHLSGQSGGPSYAFEDKFPEQTLYPNSITGFVLQAKGKDDKYEYSITLKPDRDITKIFSPTVELDYDYNE